MVNNIRTRMAFAYQKVGSTLRDEITLSDAPTDVATGAVVPAVGDLVTLIQCYPESERGNPKSFRVIARQYHYTQENPKSKGIGRILECYIEILVTDSD